MQVQCHMSSWRQSKVGVVKIDAAKQMQQGKNTISDLSQSEVRYVLSTQSPLIKYHQLRYTHEHERKLSLRSNDAIYEHIKKQKAAYKRLYPSRQRTSVIIKLMKAIEQFEKSGLRLAVPSNHLSKSIPDQFRAWKTSTNVARSSKLTNFQTDSENDCSNKIEKTHEDSSITSLKKCASQVSPIVPKTTLRQRQLVPLEYEDKHGSGATSPSTLSPSPPRNKVRRANKTKAQFHSRKVRVDSQVSRRKKLNDGLAVGDSLKKMGHIFPVVLSNGIRVKREREIVPLATPQFGLYLNEKTKL